MLNCRFRPPRKFARGVLDAVREENADLIVLGLNKPDHGQVIIGAIPENIAATAPCDVLIFRTGFSQEFERIVVPANGSEHSRVASQVAILLGEAYQKPVEAMYVQEGAYAPWVGYGHLAVALADIPGAQRVKRTLIHAGDPVQGILARLDEHDLLLLGYAKRSDWQRWLYGDFSRQLLNHAPGPVILTSRSEEPAATVPLIERLLRWSRRTLTRVEQDDLVRQAREMAAASLDFNVLIVVAALLATFGLLTSSSAVIIGAMLVAPLMSPLIAFSVGITAGRVPLLRRSSLSVLQGFVLAFAIALLIGLISPSAITTPEMAARGNPTVLDMGVALASGIIGAYATARKEIPAALAGVAIAAALMPPVCTIGLGIAFGNAGLARGAALLFTTNIISIILAAWGVFFWLGIRPQVSEDSRIRPYISAALVGMFALVMAFFLLSDVNPNTFENGVEQQLRAAFQRDELIDFEVHRSTPLQIVVTVRRQANRLQDNSEVLDARSHLEQALHQPVDLQVVIEPVYSADQVLIRQTLASIFPEVQNIQIMPDDPTKITITLPNAQFPIANSQVTQAQIQLSAAFGQDINLSVLPDSPPTPTAVVPVSPTPQPTP